jgi:hypothetical protein
MYAEVHVAGRWNSNITQVHRVPMTNGKPEQILEDKVV